jgi:hypothetical protein
LVDTNVILECHRSACWNALTGGYRIETVETCVIETQTGFQRRRPEQQITTDALVRLAKVATVSDADRAMALTSDSQLAALDPGERDLWANALTRSDAWVLCGPDKASLRVGVRLGWRDRLVSLEALLDDIGHRPRLPLRIAYTARWLAECLNELVLLEGRKRDRSTSRN